MPVNKLIFADAAKARDVISVAQQREIQKLYEQWAKEIAKKASWYNKRPNSSAPISERQMRELQRMLEERSKQIANQVFEKAKDSIYLASDAVVKSNAEWLEALGFADEAASMAFNSVPSKIVDRIITGKIYEGGWSLSKSIWSDNEDTLKKVSQIIAGGLAKNESAYEIAKSLESFVSPVAKKQWNLRAPDGKRIYPKNVDYNSQRLVRTLTQHGYQQSFIETTKDNPFITEYIWVSNGSRVCPICKARDGARFKKTELPMDHPQGMCTMVPDVAKDMNKRLEEWFKADEGTYPDIDNFASQLGYKGQVLVETGRVGESIIKKYGTSSSKTPTYWLSKLTNDEKAKIKEIKGSQSWQKWYNENVFKGKNGPVENITKEVPTERFDPSKWLNGVMKNDMHDMQLKEDKWIASLTSEEKLGVKSYTSNMYGNMNKYLRDIANGLSEEDAMLSSMMTQKTLSKLNMARSAMSKSTLEEVIFVRRGTDIGDIAGAFMDGHFGSNVTSLKDMIETGGVESLNKKFSGAEGKFSSFLSTSSDYNKGFDGSVEVIAKLNKGVQGSSVTKISRYGVDEGEFLVDAGHVVKFVKAETSEGHMGSKIRIFLEVLAKESKV